MTATPHEARRAGGAAGSRETSNLRAPPPDSPAAPRTATFLCALADEAKPLAKRPVERATERENIVRTVRWGVGLTDLGSRFR
jgi:hypothetical protein